MAKKKPKASNGELLKPKFQHGQTVTFTHRDQEVDGIVMAYDGECYFVRLIGEFYDLHPEALLPLYEEQLTAAPSIMDDPGAHDDDATTLRRLWDREAAKRLMGRTITHARYQTKREAAQHGWDTSSVMLFLDDGAVWCVSRDDGNGPAALFGETDGDDEIMLPVL